jgi:ribosome assembly protein YihI (activator of Der GTPase)
MMPSKTPKQKRTMAAAAHDPKFAAKVGIPVKVAKEFNKADQKKGKRKK